jgi:hypothetical protein
MKYFIAEDNTKTLDIRLDFGLNLASMPHSTGAHSNAIAK